MAAPRIGIKEKGKAKKKVLGARVRVSGEEEGSYWYDGSSRWEVDDEWTTHMGKCSVTPRLFISVRFKPMDGGIVHGGLSVMGCIVCFGEIIQ